jgi:fluoroquinolone transport system permease protein
VVIGFVFSTTYILLTTPLTGLVELSGLLQILPAALVASLFAPVVSLFLVAFARNKLEGFALMKGAGVVLLGPLGSFFVDGGAQYLFGILPTFWSLRAFVASLEHEPYAGYITVGIAYNLLLIGILYRRYQVEFARSM